jgi:hypothetical protein
MTSQPLHADRPAGKPPRSAPKRSDRMRRRPCMRTCQKTNTKKAATRWEPRAQRQSVDTERADDAPAMRDASSGLRFAQTSQPFGGGAVARLGETGGYQPAKMRRRASARLLSDLGECSVRAEDPARWRMRQAGGFVALRNLNQGTSRRLPALIASDGGGVVGGLRRRTQARRFAGAGRLASRAFFVLR